MERRGTRFPLARASRSGGRQLQILTWCGLAPTIGGLKQSPPPHPPERLMAATILNVDVLTIQPLIALIIGILILLVPRFLNVLVAIYLILIGLSGLWPHLFAR